MIIYDSIFNLYLLCIVLRLCNVVVIIVILVVLVISGIIILFTRSFQSQRSKKEETF